MSGVRCGQRVSVDSAGRHVIGQHEVSRGGQSTSRTLSKISIYEKKGRGEPIGDSASNLHTDNVSRIIHEFGGATGGGKNKQKINLGN